MDRYVSVIIPTYGGNKSLKRAVDSVLMQDYCFFEIIVVDDNNPQTGQRNITETIMAEYSDNNRIRYIQHDRNKNGSVARNTGAREARGEYLAFLDDDDIFLQGKLRKQVEFLSVSTEFDAVYCWRRERSGEVRSNLQGDLSEALLDLSFTPCTPSLMIRKKSYFDIGGFDETFYRHQDFEFLLRFFEKHKIGVVPEILIEIIGNSVDNQPRGERAVNLKKKYLETFLPNINKIDKQKKGFRKYVYAKHYAALMIKLFRYGDVKLAFETYVSDAYKGGILFWKEFFLQLKLVICKKTNRLLRKSEEKKDEE